MIESLMKVATIYHDPSINAWRIELPGGNYFWVSGELIKYAHEEVLKNYMNAMGIKYSEDILQAMKNPAYDDWMGEYLLLQRYV